MKYLVEDIEFDANEGNRFFREGADQLVVEVDDGASDLDDEEFVNLIIEAIIKETGAMVYGFGGIEPFEDGGDE